MIYRKHYSLLICSNPLSMHNVLVTSFSWSIHLHALMLFIMFFHCVDDLTFLFHFWNFTCYVSIHLLFWYGHGYNLKVPHRLNLYKEEYFFLHLIKIIFFGMKLKYYRWLLFPYHFVGWFSSYPQQNTWTENADNKKCWTRRTKRVGFWYIWDCLSWQMAWVRCCY